MASHGEIWTIDLQIKARIYDGSVFIAHGVGDGLEVLLAGRVIFVAEKERNDTRRSGAHEAMRGAGRLHGGAEVGCVAAGWRAIAQPNGRIASGRAAARTPGVAKHAAAQRRKIVKVPVLERIV